MGENASRQPPTQYDLALWASTYGIHHPVVADPGFGVTVRYTGPVISLPTMHQIGPGMETLRIDTWVTEAEVQDALP